MANERNERYDENMKKNPYGIRSKAKVETDSNKLEFWMKSFII